MIAAFGYNCLVYFICGKLAGSRAVSCPMTPVDRMIPLVEWTILIYFGCYLFWIANYIMIYRESREHAYRFFISDLISRTVCMICFLLIPFRMTRPEIEGNGLFSNLMRFLYQVDEPVNLFPSIHCLVSWNCWLGIRGSRKVPIWYQRLSILMAVSVFLSTLTTKQHVLLDVAGGFLLSEISWRIAMKTEWWHYVEKCFDKIADSIFGERG